MNRKIALRMVHMRRIYADWSINIWSAVAAEQVRRREDDLIVEKLLREFGLDRKHG